MGKCCSKSRENLISNSLKKTQQKAQEALIIVNNEDNTFEKIKISNQKTGNIIDIDGKDGREIVSMDRDKEDKNEQEEKLLLNNNSKSKHKELNESSIMEKKDQLHAKKYEILTNEKSLIKLASKYKTNDLDLKAICDIMNDEDEKWELILNDKICKIQRKISADNPTPIARTTAIIEGYTAKEIFDSIAIIPNRLEWDKSFLEFASVEQNLNEGWEVFYMSLKSPVMFVTERDLVQRRRIYHPLPDANSFLIHFKSIDHPQCPVISKFVRANTLISGYFMQTIQANPPKSLICTISQTDIGGSLPKGIVNNLAAKAPKDWILSLIKGLNALKIKQ